MLVAPFIARTIHRPLLAAVVDTSRSTTSSLPSPVRSPSPASFQVVADVERSVATWVGEATSGDWYQRQTPEVLRRRTPSLPSPSRSARPASFHAAPEGRLTAEPLPLATVRPFMR